jgi:hypothetical protein
MRLQESKLSLDHRFFMVTLNGETLYGGMFVLPGSSLGLDLPVIFTEFQGNQAVFSIRPKHPGPTEFSDFPPELQRLIARPDVRAYFAGLGKLTE